MMNEADSGVKALRELATVPLFHGTSVADEPI